MYLLKEFLLPYAVVRNSPDMYGESIVRWTESPHSSFHWLSRKRAIEQNKKALSSLIWISFCSVNHHYLSGRFFPPPRQSWFFSAPYAIVVFVRRECVHVATHLRRREKTFGKLIAGKKEMISRKRVYTTTTTKKKMLKEKTFYPYTDDEYTNIFKKEICRWNKLLELSADHFSKKRMRAGARKWNKKYENQSIRDTENDFTWRNVLCRTVDWLINSLPHVWRYVS